MRSSYIYKYVDWTWTAEYHDRKAIDRDFLHRYKYPIGSWEAIETNMATKCFYEFMSSLIKLVSYFHRRSAKSECTIPIWKEPIEC